MYGMDSSAKHRRCLVLAGGGFRFAYYLGVHAALEACGRRPDVLLATCGGAMAGAIIAGLPDAASRRAWAAGPDMYRFLCEIASTPRATPWHALGGAGARWLARRAARRIPDPWHDYLFELPERLPLPCGAPADAPALVVVGTRLLFGAHEAGGPRGGRELFAQVAFAPPRAAGLLAGMAAPGADPRWSAGAVAPRLETDSLMPLEDAVRSSIADMFYFRCHAHGGQHYMGGVIDLFPIELARRLAREVVMERKAPFNPWLALPALRGVLGIDGAARLVHVHAQSADAWFDTRDYAAALRGQGVGKRVDWRRNRVVLVPAASQAEHAAQVGAQWDYGYRRGMAALGQEEAHACES